LAYFLSRSVIVLIGWGSTCVLLAAASSKASLAVFAFAGISWAMVWFVLFGYIHKIRNEAFEYDRRPSSREAVNFCGADPYAHLAKVCEDILKSIDDLIAPYGAEIDVTIRQQ